MEIFAKYIAVILSGLLTENILLTRALDAGDMIGMINSPKKIKNFSAVFAIVISISSVLCGVADILAGRFNFEFYSFLKPTIYLALVSVVYLSLYFILKSSDKFKEEFKHILAYASINSGVYGVMFIENRYEMGIVESLAYGLSASAGMFLALFVILNARQAIKYSDVPRLFRGLPILLIYIGLLALGIFGLFGHPLPA